MAQLTTPISCQDDAIHVSTDLVTVAVTVLDRDGRYVSDLRQEDFQIFENGSAQEIALFEPVEKPITVLMLLDVSGSMYLQLQELANASSVFVKQLRADDQLMAAIFGEEVELIIPPTRIRSLEKGFKLRTLPTYRDTMVYDAVDFGIKKTMEIDGRKAIILFSDGVGSGLSASMKRNLRDAEEGETQIYTVQFRFSTVTDPPDVARKKFRKQINTATTYMQGLAQKSGGRYYFLEEIADLAGTFRRIADELSKQYSLGYYPDDPGENGERRRITVKVKVPNVVVRSRNEVVYKRQASKAR